MVDEPLADVYSIDIHTEAAKDRTQAIAALQQTGKLLAQTAPHDRVTVILGGVVAAMVVADLPVTRATHDCDVLVSEPGARNIRIALPASPAPPAVG